MKKILSLLLLGFFVWGCGPNEVDLMAIDKVTGGKEKVWVVTEYTEGGHDYVAQGHPCYTGATLFFSKGDPNADYPGPYYELRWSEGVKNCGLDGSGDPIEYIFFMADDGSYVDFYDNIDIKDEIDRLGLDVRWFFHTLTNTHLHMDYANGAVIIKAKIQEENEDD